MKFSLLASVFALLASAFFTASSTPESLAARYADAKAGGAPVKILVVPGHDDQYFGTEYHGMKEADVTLALGKEVYADLAQDPLFAVTLARTDEGYEPELATYFTDHRSDIIAFQQSQRGLMQKFLSAGKVISDVVVNHNTAPSEVALRLWGINKWANENKYDLVIHIHFNDTPRADTGKPGPYTGFAIYIPEHQFSNSAGSQAVADAVEKRLEEAYTPSSLPKESGTPVEDQELIAIGSNNSLDAAGMLIEYAYIYEPMLQSDAGRAGALATMAQKTYQGVEDFFTQPI